MAKASDRIKRGLLLLSGLVLNLAVLASGARLYLGIPQNAAGMAAKGVCSAAFVAGRPWQALMAQDVWPASALLRLVSVTIDENARSVTAKFAGLFARRAALLPQRGCVLDVAAVSPSAALAPRTSAAAEQAWPQSEAALPMTEWGAGVDAAAL